MLRTLDHEIPSQIGETNQVDCAMRVHMLQVKHRDQGYLCARGATLIIGLPVNKNTQPPARYAD